MNQTGARHTCTRILRAAHGGRSRRMRGFTLVELMITLAVAAILITIAVPSFKHIIASSKLTTTANSMVSALNVARMQAIKRNAHAQFCSNDGTSNGSDKLGAACDDNIGAVYVLTGTAAASTTVQVHATTLVAQGQQQLVGNVTPLRFDPQGLAHALGEAAPFTGDIADICTSAISSGNHRVVHMTTGSIIAVATTVGACP